MINSAPKENLYRVIATIDGVESFVGEARPLAAAMSVFDRSVPRIGFPPTSGHRLKVISDAEYSRYLAGTR